MTIGRFIVSLIGAAFHAGWRSRERMQEAEGEPTDLFARRRLADSPIELIADELRAAGSEVASRTIANAPETTPLEGILAGFLAGASYIIVRMAREKERGDAV